MPELDPNIECLSSDTLLIPIKLHLPYFNAVSLFFIVRMTVLFFFAETFERIFIH